MLEHGPSQRQSSDASSQLDATVATLGLGALLSAARRLRRAGVSERVDRQEWRRRVVDLARWDRTTTFRPAPSEAEIDAPLRPLFGMPSTPPVRGGGGPGRHFIRGADVAPAYVALEAFDCQLCQDTGRRRLWDVERGHDDPAFGRYGFCSCVPLPARLVGVGVDPAAAGATLTGFRDAAGKRAALEYALSWGCVDSVVLASDPESEARWGTGKTHLAIALLRKCLEAGRDDARFVFVPDALNGIRDSFRTGERDPYLSRLEDVDVLVLDDLGAEQLTEWSTAFVRLLITARHSARRLTIITTNLATPGEVRDAYGGAVASRLTDVSWARWVAVGGADFRRVATDAR